MHTALFCHLVKHYFNIGCSPHPLYFFPHYQLFILFLSACLHSTFPHTHTYTHAHTYTETSSRLYSEYTHTYTHSQSRKQTGRNLEIGTRYQLPLYMFFFKEILIENDWQEIPFII